MMPTMQHNGVKSLDVFSMNASKFHPLYLPIQNCGIWVKVRTREPTDTIARDSGKTAFSVVAPLALECPPPGRSIWPLLFCYSRGF